MIVFSTVALPIAIMMMTVFIVACKLLHGKNNYYNNYFSSVLIRQIVYQKTFKEHRLVQHRKNCSCITILIKIPFYHCYSSVVDKHN